MESLSSRRLRRRQSSTKLGLLWECHTELSTVHSSGVGKYGAICGPLSFLMRPAEQINYIYSKWIINHPLSSSCISKRKATFLTFQQRTIAGVSFQWYDLTKSLVKSCPTVRGKTFCALKELTQWSLQHHACWKCENRSEKAFHESVKTLHPCLRWFSKFSCFLFFNI